jgi:hypothetical protein
MMTPTTERRALNTLLALFPDRDLLAVNWQSPNLGREAGPWLLVSLGQRSENGNEAWARSEYAIWKRTGAIHLIDADGAVIDPPFIPGDQ